MCRQPHRDQQNTEGVWRDQGERSVISDQWLGPRGGDVGKNNWSHSFSVGIVERILIRSWDAERNKFRSTNLPLRPRSMAV